MSDAEFAELLKASDRDPLALARCFVAMYGDDPAKAGEEDELATAPVALAVHVIAQAEELAKLRADNVDLRTQVEHRAESPGLDDWARQLLDKYAGYPHLNADPFDSLDMGQRQMLIWEYASELLARGKRIEGLQALLDDMRETVADRGQLIGDRMKLRAALGEALDGWVELWCSDNNDSPPDRIAELRRLTDGE